MSRNKEKNKNKSWKREAAEWGLMLGIIATLYLTGLHTEVIGKLQSALLYTGLIQADTEELSSAQAARYDLPLLSLDGAESTLEQHAGKTIFLNFWATWCPPCIAEMPNIQKLYESRDPDKVAFVMVSLDEKTETARSFIMRKEFTFPVYMLNGPKPPVYTTQVVPTTYVISPDGEIVLKHEGMANYNTDSFHTYLDKLSE